MRLAHMGKESHWIWDDTTPGIEKGDLLIATLGDGQIGHLNYVCERAKEAGAYLCVVTGSPSGRTAKDLADQIFFLPAAVYRGRDEVVPSIQPMGNLFEQCLLVAFDIAVMLLVDQTPGLTFEKMSHRHRNVE
ncbi:MAG: 6-phospho-3-hexuloisomerase, partial [Deltaproteobacteria bacterium]|jgi:6-phospho-3-hexuloisomerase|nr:6-phospho-3-hexuloisomerase [Deltaproteobacteria bacterium]